MVQDLNTLHLVMQVLCICILGGREKYRDMPETSGILFVQNFIKFSKYCSLLLNQDYDMQIIDRVMMGLNSCTYKIVCFIGESTHIGSVPTLPGSCSTPWTAGCCSRSIWGTTQQPTTCIELLPPPTSCQLWPTSSDACPPWTRAWNHSRWKAVSSGYLFIEVRNIIFWVFMLCWLVNSYWHFEES